MSSPETRDECVYLAKLAEQAERYDEMVSLVAILYCLVWFVWSRSRTISSPGAESYHYRTLYINSNKRKNEKLREQLVLEQPEEVFVFLFFFLVPVIPFLSPG